MNLLNVFLVWIPKPLNLLLLSDGPSIIIIIIIVVVIIIIISFMQGIYIRIPEEKTMFLETTVLQLSCYYYSWRI